VVTLDSDPGSRPDRAGSEQTMAVLAMLARLPSTYARREDFIARVHAEGHSRAIADWLAMNLERVNQDGVTSFALRVDLAGIGQLLDSYFSLDLWSVLERSRAQLDVVIGGRSRVWDTAQIARIQALASTRPASLRVSILPNAGHWVHVDEPAALRAALLPAR
jgi:pimeloyl-ACP methyl ester carboxylesterase